MEDPENPKVTHVYLQWRVNGEWVTSGDPDGTPDGNGGLELTNPSSDDPAANADYLVTTTTDNPKRISDSSQHMFPDSPTAPGDSTTYLTLDFFNNKYDGSSYEVKNGKVNGVPDDADNVRLAIDVTAKVTGNGDNVGHDSGKLVNDASSDDHHKPGQTAPPTVTPSAGFEFAKSEKPAVTKDAAQNIAWKDQSGKVYYKKGDTYYTDEAETKAADPQPKAKDLNPDIHPVAGAVFRLVDPKNSSHFLATDGKFHPDGDNVTFIQATSNSDGIVTFVGIPIFQESTDSAGKKTYTYNDGSSDQPMTFDVVEYSAPDGYDRATIPFKQVTFANHTGAVKQTETDLAPKNWTASTSPLDFGKWAIPSDEVGYFTNYQGTAMTTGLMNWKNGQPGKPIHLPLTGGQGIILLLIIGAVIMAIVMIERKRRQAKANR